MIKLTNCLPAILESARHIQKYPSVAEDSGTDHRSAQHWVTRTLNSLTGQSEYAQALCASTLLGYTSTICSHSFSYCFLNRAINYYDKTGMPRLTLFSSREKASACYGREGRNSRGY
jgi:hypothetical protein